MEESLDEIKLILKDINSQSETFKNVKIIGNYSLNRNDVSAQVIDWVFHSLEEKCPYNLAVAIAKETEKQVNKNISELQLKEENINQAKLLNSITLYNETMKTLALVCEQLGSDITKNQMDTFVSPYKSSVFAIKNKRRKMEDRHVIHSDLNLLMDLKNAPTHTYYAVFDGHSGVDAASYASAHLHINIANHPDFLTDTRLAILEGYKITDVNFSRMCVEENLRSGTTAICALMRESTLFLSWVGDSQAVLVKEGKPVIVTSPHKPDREDERKRIEELGGCITFMGTWRVNGMLAVTRALGDFDHRPYVSNEPEITVHELDGTEDFLILACDGLWDGMSPEDVIPALYHNLLERAIDEPLDTVAAKLVHQSKLQGSEDNITAIVVFLRDINIIKKNAEKFLPNKVNISQNIFELNGEEKECSEGMFNSQIQKPTCLELNNSSMKKMKNAANVLSAAGIGDHSTYSFSENSECLLYSNTEMNSSESSTALIAPETTALSELPTPPIDDVLASQQFEKELDSAVYDSDASLSKISSNVVSSSDCDMKELSQSEEFEFTQKEVTVTQEEKLSPKEALDIASNVVSSTIETAVKCVSEKESSETAHVSTQKLNPYAEPFVMKSFIPEDNLNSTDVDIYSNLMTSPKSSPEKSELKSDVYELNDSDKLLIQSGNQHSTVSDYSILSLDSEANIINIKDSDEALCLLDDDKAKPSLKPSNSEAIVQNPEHIDSEIDFKTIENVGPVAGSEIPSNSQSTDLSDIFSSLSLSTKEHDISLHDDKNKSEQEIDLIGSNEISMNQMENNIVTKSTSLNLDVEPMDIDVIDEKLNLSSKNMEDLVNILEASDNKEVITLNEISVHDVIKSAENFSASGGNENKVTDIGNTDLETTNEMAENLLNVSEALGKASFNENYIERNVNEIIENVTEDKSIIAEPQIDLIPDFITNDTKNAPQANKIDNENSIILIEQTQSSSSNETVEGFNVSQDIENKVIDKTIIKVELVNEEMLKCLNENTDHLGNAPEVKNEIITNAEDKNEENLTDTNKNSGNLVGVTSVIENQINVVENNSNIDNLDKGNSFITLQTEMKIGNSPSNELTSDKPNANNSILSVSEMEQNGSFLSDTLTDTNEASIKLVETLNDITSFSESANGLVPDPSVILKEMALPITDDKDNVLTTTTAAAILPSDHSDESVCIEAIAVDLQSIPVGVPEAEGVTEDIDSDSEKDGGWSYMKGNTVGGVKQKIAGSALKAGKSGSKLDTVKTKENLKTSTEKIKVKTASNIDRSKKYPLEKKVLDNKSKLTKTIPPASNKVAVEKQSKTMPSGIKRDIPTSKVTTLTTNKVSKAPTALRNPPTQVKSTSSSYTNRTQTVSKPLPTAAVAKPKSNIGAKGPAASSLPKKQLSTQTIKSTISSAPLVKRPTTAAVPSKITSTKSTLQKVNPSEPKVKPPTLSLKRTFPSALKKPDGKETKELDNKQITEKRINSLPKTSRAPLLSSTTSSLRSTIPSSNAKSILKPRSAPLKNEGSKNVPKTQISRLTAKSSTQSKSSKDVIKSKDKASAAGQKKLLGKDLKEDTNKNSAEISPTEEEKLLREVNDKEIPTKELVDSTPVQDHEKIQNGCITESKEVEIVAPMESLL